MNLNLKQGVAITLAVLGVLMVSTTQLTDLFGPGVAKTVVSIAALTNSVLASVLAVITSQGSMIRDVDAMPGVDHIVVNEKANTTLAQIAADPDTKVVATPAAAAAVARTAEG